MPKSQSHLTWNLTRQIEQLDSGSNHRLPTLTDNNPQCIHSTMSLGN